MNKSAPVIAILLAFTFGALGMTGCASAETVDLPAAYDYDLQGGSESAKGHLKVGAIIGPYSDMFTDAISPSLMSRGYTTELVLYNDFTLPNEYLANGQTDLNIFQNYQELIDYKSEHDASLSAVAEVPTYSMGIFSEKYESLDEIDEGCSVIVPEDGKGLARALAVLEDAEIIRLSPVIDRAAATISSIVSNPHSIEIIPMEAPTLPYALPEHGLAVIDGNFAINGGLDLADALYTEQLGSYHFNVIAVRTEDLGEQFVQDIIKILRSDAYRAVIEDPELVYARFERPPSYYGKTGGS